MSGEAITYEQCGDCRHNWVLPRMRCPRCGGVDIGGQTASGRGRVYSVTVVHRAPADAFRPLLPYRIGLVDLEEGPRLMAHLADDVPIGARVEGAMQPVAGENVPVFRQARRPATHKV